MIFDIIPIKYDTIYDGFIDWKSLRDKLNPFHKPDRQTKEN